MHPLHIDPLSDTHCAGPIKNSKVNPVTCNPVLITESAKTMGHNFPDQWVWVWEYRESSIPLLAHHIYMQYINMVYCRAASKQVARGPIPIEAGVFDPLDWWYRLRVHHITQKNPTTVLRQRFSYNGVQNAIQCIFIKKMTHPEQIKFRWVKFMGKMGMGQQSRFH